MSDAPDQHSKPDYRSTVFLPRTDFPMKAGLPQKEPAILARWRLQDLYGQLRRARAGREKFILHDGPPYANGDIHIGHALNHVLKDMVVRTQTLLGKDAPYVPGWDCHGLPIEWKVEEQYRKKKLDKPVPSGAEADPSALLAFRAECRAYAQHWVDTQREQLQRLGIGGDWDRPYLTMDFEAEATIVAELLKFAGSGQLYRGAKPVMWSPVEKTALAEAEIEYEDVVSTQIDVAFEIIESPIPELVGAHAVVWTTTPWTIPVNQAIAYGPEVEYALVQIQLGVSDKGKGNLSLEQQHNPLMSILDGKQVLIAAQLIAQFKQRLNDVIRNDVTQPTVQLNAYLHPLQTMSGSDLAGTIARHPIYTFLRHSRESGNPDFLSALGPRFRGDDGEVDEAAWQRALEFFERPRPFLPGEFVTTETGTGLVHLAPDHGEDDFDLCKANGIDPVFALEGDGRYRADWGWLGGLGSVINAKFNAPDGPICNDLREAGALLAASADYSHSYPHSWRSKAKVIYRCTPQWFIAMDRVLAEDVFPEGAFTEEEQVFAAAFPHTLRNLAMTAIRRTRFVPEKGRNRIGSMVADRPDWVISRQRAWGVPITLFVDRKTGRYLVDDTVNARIVAAVRERGVDAWSDERAGEFLGPGRDPQDYERVTDILDVWFDSGCTHAFVLQSGKWPDLVRDDPARPPADLYLEGSDQHRGWFQSSLLESCGTRGRAPYAAVLTHGFTMDARGMKMSKSLGNTVSPTDLMRDTGADILRLWALSVDFTEDHRIGKEILAGVGDQYRKLRNTFRYLLGALDGFDETERVTDHRAMPELERYLLHLLAELDLRLRRAVEDFDFNTYTRLLADFANDDLSALLFDIRKDCLYCDAPDDPKRRSYRTVLDTLFHALVRWAAPVLVFTAEEVWGTRLPDAGSVHLLEWPKIDAEWRDETLAGDWRRLRELRALVSGNIEPLRRAKKLGGSLEAKVIVGVADAATLELLEREDFGELCIVSDLAVDGRLHGVDGVSIERTANHKCGRCWRHLPEVGEDGALCGRCEAVVGRSR